MSTPKWQAWVIGGQVIRTCTSVAPASRSSSHERAGGGAAHQRVVDHHDPLAGEVLGERVELQRDAALAEVLRRLDERAADVAVLDQPVVVRDAARPAVADRRGDRRVGDGDDDVGVGGRLGGQLLAEALADVVDVAAGPHAVGAAEVDELERAPRRRGGRRERLAAVRSRRPAA